VRACRVARTTKRPALRQRARVRDIDRTGPLKSARRRPI